MNDTRASSDPVPFFEDTRTLGEKLRAEHREWRPHQPEHDCPAVIFGLVLERGTFTSTYDNSEKDTMRVLTEGNTEWSVIGFHGWLQSELERKNPRVGDFVAVAFNGKGKAKTGESEPYLYQLEVERNPAGPALTEPTSRDEAPESHLAEPVTGENAKTSSQNDPLLDDDDDAALRHLAENDQPDDDDDADWESRLASEPELAAVVKNADARPHLPASTLGEEGYDGP
jgi:hypothetical protein